jgi:hypoxanthine phosphoribosyltransferase
MTDEVLRLTWKDVQKAVNSIAEEAKAYKWDTVVAVMRGGMVPARMLAAKLGVTNIVVWNGKHGTLGVAEGHTLVVDDIADSGHTMARAKFAFGAPMAVLVDKTKKADYAGMVVPDKRWVIFPWEGVADKVNERQMMEEQA